MLPRRRCPFCRHWYHPHPRLNRRQQTCGRTECRRQQKQKSNQQWRAENPDYFRGAYARQKEKYGTRADYMRLYRQQHPDCVAPHAVGMPLAVEAHVISARYELFFLSRIDTQVVIRILGSAWRVGLVLLLAPTVGARK